MALNDLDRNDFLPPGGVFQDLVGAPVNAATFTPTKMIHHVITTATITTITSPKEGFSGPIYLVADSVFAITSSGNIATPGFGTTVVADRAFGFVYDQKKAKWYALGQIV